MGRNKIKTLRVSCKVCKFNLKITGENPKETLKYLTRTESFFCHKCKKRLIIDGSVFNTSSSKEKL